MLQLFRPAAAVDIEEGVDKVSRDFIEATNFCTPDVMEEMIANRYRTSAIPEDPMVVSE